jgi:branched-chain amino acid aminotransferase
MRLMSAARLRAAPLSSKLLKPYSTASNEGQLSVQKLKISQTLSPKPLIPLNKLVFGQAFTDHMLTADWSASKGSLLLICFLG